MPWVEVVRVRIRVKVRVKVRVRVRVRVRNLIVIVVKPQRNPTTDELVSCHNWLRLQSSACLGESNPASTNIVAGRLSTQIADTGLSTAHRGAPTA